MAPAVKRLLPPASSSGARSSTSTETPCSAAASAAHRAALPPPTTTTSADAGSIAYQLLVRIDGRHYTRLPADIQARQRMAGLPLFGAWRNAILAVRTPAWNGDRTVAREPANKGERSCM